MKTRLLFFLCSLAWVSVATAQRWQPQRPQLQGLQRGGASQKIASHGDHPEIEWSFDWNTGTSNWDSVYQISHTYLPTGQVAEEIVYHYSGNAFVPESRNRTTYGVHPDPDRQVFYIWNGSSWSLGPKVESFYDLQGNLTDRVQFQWNGASYDTSYAERYIYDYVFGNRISETVYQVWLSSTHLYENLLRDTDSFPTAAGWDTETTYSWDGTNWVESYRIVNALWHNFEKHQLASYDYQTWTSPGWQDFERTTGTFGSFDSPTYLTERWNGSSWDTTAMDIYTYDSLEHEIQSEHWDWFSGWFQTLGHRYDYVYDGLGNTLEFTYSIWNQAYEPTFRHVYANFFTEAASPRLVTTSVTAYPNPCVDHLNFRLDLKQNGPVHIALYDLQGRLRMQTATSTQAGSEISLPVSEILENGTYSYRVQTKEGTATGKVAVQR